jgi:hypothetical protein
MKKLLLVLLIALAASSARAQSATGTAQRGFLAQWRARASATQARQPGWAVPLVTTTTGLIQVARTDFLRQITPTHTITWNLDNSKGVNLVPWANTEVAVNLPPFLRHNSTAADGFGDFSYLVKYRLLSGNAGHGNYTLSAWMAGTAPTGSYKNGASNATLMPNVGGGKGVGRFDVQTTLGATLPVGILAFSRQAGRSPGIPLRNIAWAESSGQRWRAMRLSSRGEAMMERRRSS